MKQLSKIHSTQEVIKKSVFITIVGQVATVDEAKVFLQKQSQANVTHNCWAYKIGQQYRFNDDGEPSGTAGMPILKAIEGQKFDNTIALVIRHYGGIKLGTGGLMRAYGGSVNRCLQAADYETIHDMAEVSLSVPFQYIQSIHNLCKKYDAIITSENFTENGAILMHELLNHKKEGFIKEAINLSKGTIKKLSIKH